MRLWQVRLPLPCCALLQPVLRHPPVGQVHLGPGEACLSHTMPVGQEASEVQPAGMHTLLLQVCRMGEQRGQVSGVVVLAAGAGVRSTCAALTCRW